jgi:uncharacterized membrane protein
MRKATLLSGDHSRTRGRWVVHILLLVYGAILVSIVLVLIFNLKVSSDIFFGLSIALLFFAVGQSIYELGIKNAVSFLVLTSAIGFLAEVLGTNSGIPFGKYYYTDFLGEKFLGVPVVVPLVWFVISYLSYSIVAGNSRKSSWSSGKVSIVAKVALLSAFGAVSWDFMIDPMFSAYGYWVWTGQFLPLPELDGIPLTNFLGWFVLVALMIFVGLSLLSPKNGSALVRRINARDSVIAYILLMVDGVVANFSLHNFAITGIGLFAMIAFIMIAIYYPKRDVRVESPGREVT